MRTDSGWHLRSRLLMWWWFRPTAGTRRFGRLSEDIAKALEGAGFDVLLDDRDERPGVKFKDADLIGIPFRINVGKKVTEDLVEVVRRSTLAREDVKISAISEHLRALVRENAG